MTESVKSHVRWVKEEEKLLVSMFKQGESIEEMSAQLKRTEMSIYNKLGELGYSMQTRRMKMKMKERRASKSPVVRSTVVPEKKTFWQRVFNR